MPRMTMLCGPAAAGKTTIAMRIESRGALRLSMDEAMWAAGHRDGTAPQTQIERLYAGLLDAARAALGRSQDVVVDLSMAARWVRDEWRGIAEEAGATVELVVVTAPIAVLWRRIEARRGREDANAVVLDRATLERYVDGFEWPGDDEPHRVVDTGAPGEPAA